MSTRRVKREGSIPEGTFQRYMNVNKKRLVISTRETDTGLTIYIGGKGIYCIDILLSKKDSGGFFKKGLLSKIRWDSGCSLDMNFKKKDDSIMIMKLALTYVFDNYPEVEVLKFKDFSTKECDNGSKVNLAAMKYLTVGKTWYEDKFGAFLDEEGELYFRVKEEKLRKLKETPWELLLSQINIAKSINTEEETLRSLYEKASTWQEFFMPLLNELGVEQFCIQISPWFNRFVDNFLDLHQEELTYLLPVKSYCITYKLSNITHGGTRRQSKIMKTS